MSARSLWILQRVWFSYLSMNQSEQTFSIKDLLKEHLGEFLLSYESDLPNFAAIELEEARSCGDPDQGISVLKCKGCSIQKYLPFSCKKRGFCPSCGIRRMNEKAIILGDALPQINYRQWVFSVPLQLRCWMAYDHSLQKVVLQIATDSISSYLKGLCCLEGVPGSIAFIQRFGGGANLNIHFHILFSDGVYARNKRGRWKFQKVRPLTEDDVEQVLWDITNRLRKLLDAWNYLQSDASDLDEVCVVKSSIEQKIAFGERAGQPVRRMKDHDNFSLDFSPKSAKPLCVSSSGFSLHAGVRVKARDRHRLEAVIRYMARPAIIESQYSILDDGSIKLHLRKSWSDGTEALIFSPEELIEKLACLVPRPYKNMIIYSGFLGARSKVRRLVLPQYKPKSINAGSRSYYIHWAELLRRTFYHDRSICEGCGGQLRVLRVVLESMELEVLLSSLKPP